MSAFESLLIEGLWRTVTWSDLPDRYQIPDARKTPVDFCSSLRKVKKLETEAVNYFSERFPVCDLFTCDYRGPVDRLLACEARKRGAGVHFVEDGLGAYVNSVDTNVPVGQMPPAAWGWLRDVPRFVWFSLRRQYPDSLKKYMNGVAFEAFLDLFNRRDVLGFERLRYDDIFCTFPDRFPDWSERGQRQSLSDAFNKENTATLLSVTDAGKIVDSECGRREKREGSALFLSQVMSEDRYVPEETEMVLIKEVLLSMVKMFPKVFYKAHPRDRASKAMWVKKEFPKVDVLELRSAIPIEFFVERLGIQTVVGGFSSTLAYIGMIDGHRSCSLLGFYSRRLSEMGVSNNVFNGILQDLRPRFSDVIDWIDELKQMDPNRDLQ